MTDGSIYSSLLHRLRKEKDRHSVLFLNAGASTIGSVGTAALGFVYWGLAARFFPAHAVGVATAIVSLMGLMALIGDAGLGTLLIGETLRHKGREGGFILAALLAALAGAGVCGLAYYGLATHFGWQLGRFADSSTGAAIFIVGCAASGAASVLDQAFVGILKSALQMLRTTAFSLLKLVLLALAATSVAMQNEIFIVLTWVVSIIITVFIFGIIILKSTCSTALFNPDFRLLGERAPALVRHHMLNLATQAPNLIIPVLVTVLVSPVVGAAFFPAWMIVNFALYGSGALTTVLYTIGEAEPSHLSSRLVRTLCLSGVVGVMAATVLFFFHTPILRAFNPEYPALAGSSLQILGFGVIGMVVKQHYLAVSRLANRLGIASFYLALGGLLEIALASLGSQISGLYGFTVGWLAAVFIQAALMIGPVLKVAAHGLKPEGHPRATAGTQGARALHETAPDCGMNMARRRPVELAATKSGRPM